MSVLLDGRYVEDTVIDPAKHRFVGAFRKPYSTYSICGYIACPCGQVLQDLATTFSHYQQGHWDELQYVTILNKGE